MIGQVGENVELDVVFLVRDDRRRHISESVVVAEFSISCRLEKFRAGLDVSHSNPASHHLQSLHHLQSPMNIFFSMCP